MPLNDHNERWISGVTVLAGFTATLAVGLIYATIRWATGALPKVI
jgi:hypothetical protein